MKAEIIPTLFGTDWGGQKGCHPPPAERDLETRVFFPAAYTTVQNSSTANVTTTHPFFLAWQTRFPAECWH